VIRHPLLQVGVTIGLLVAVVALLDVDAVVTQLSDYHPGWFVVGVAVSLPQLALCAWRWRFTAARLGETLGMRKALSEYYLSTLLNQVLPTGIAGDALRVTRQGGQMDGGLRPALRSVILERASGQLALSLWALAAVPLWLGSSATAAVLGALACLGAALLLFLRSGQTGANDSLGSAARRALLADGALGTQLLVSSAVVLTFLIQFYCASRAVGLVLEPAVLLKIVPPVLLYMAVPLSVAGWGMREAASAAMFALAGWRPEQGVAVSVCYGVVTLVGSTPGLLVWASGRR